MRHHHGRPGEAAQGANAVPPSHTGRFGPRPPQLSPRQRRWTCLPAVVLWASGIAWLISRYGLRAPGELGELPAPSEAWWLRVHGAAMIGFLVAFGALLPVHVLQGWRQQRNRFSGALMLGIVGVLALTGYGLYYVASESLRGRISLLHWVLGLAAGGALIAHVILGRRTRPEEPRRSAPL